MKTSYNDALPKVDELKSFLTEEENKTEYGYAYLWEDGAGTEIRVVTDGTTVLITLYDHESTDNFFDHAAEKQLAFKEISEEAEELLNTAKKDLQWDWDSTGNIWYTAGFWSEGNEWHTSSEWEDDHDEDSAKWTISELKDSTQL